MAYICDMCKKGSMIGKTHRHHPGVAGARWKQRAPEHSRVFKPNLHWSRVVIDGVSKRFRLCTKCLRIAKEAMKTEKQAKTPVVPQVSSQPAAL